MSIEHENLHSADGKPNTDSHEKENETPQPVLPKEEITAKEEPAPADFDHEADKDQKSESKETPDSHDLHEEESKKIPTKDYDSLSISQLVGEANLLLNNHPVDKLKQAFHLIKEAFNKQFHELEENAKTKFKEQGGSEIDFRFSNKDKTDFDKIYREFRNRLHDFYKSMERQQEVSLKEREEIINELHALYTEPAHDNKEIFSKFRELKTRWHNAGRIAKAKADNIFKTYYFHLDNFYKFLDLNQDLRKMDYEHNLEIRKSIIARAEKLLNEENIQKALNELQYLHRMWKEEAVPVAEEFRETTWEKFKELTNKIHHRKEELNEQLLQQQQENLAIKHDIIEQIKSVLNDISSSKSHNAWQKSIKKVNALREKFLSVGRVPRADNQPTWDKFKEATRNFNHQKNIFYKALKSEQMKNLELKRKLIDIANEHKNSENWSESVKVVKKIQSEWKKIGHVPRKHSEKIWQEFSAANNLFFDRFKNRNNKKLEAQKDNLIQKQALLEEIEKAEKPTEKEDLLQWLNEQSIKWSSIGFVPNGKQSINKDFTKLTEKILKEAGLDAHAIEEAKWDSQLKQVKTQLDANLLRSLKIDVRKQMDETQKELTQLQNNLAFFSNADDSNPLFKNAINNIEKQVSKLDRLKAKFEDLRHINLAMLEKHQEEEKEKEEKETPPEKEKEEE